MRRRKQARFDPDEIVFWFFENEPVCNYCIIETTPAWCGADPEEWKRAVSGGGGRRIPARSGRAAVPRTDVPSSRAFILSTLAANFPYVLVFELRDKGNRTEYFLCFGTKSLKGLAAMKRAMWRADPQGGKEFSDYIALNPQLTLVPAAGPSQPLRHLLVARFKGGGWTRIEDIEEFVLTDTIYSESMHLKRKTLGPMERDRAIMVRRPAGKKDIPGQYPPGTMIRFPNRAPVKG